jgi:hypothetical protein
MDRPDSGSHISPICSRLKSRTVCLFEFLGFVELLELLELLPPRPS